MHKCEMITTIWNTHLSLVLQKDVIVILWCSFNITNSVYGNMTAGVKL